MSPMTTVAQVAEDLIERVGELTVPRNREDLRESLRGLTALPWWQHASDDDLLDAFYKALDVVDEGVRRRVQLALGINLEEEIARETLTERRALQMGAANSSLSKQREIVAISEVFWQMAAATTGGNHVEAHEDVSWMDGPSLEGLVPNQVQVTYYDLPVGPGLMLSIRVSGRMARSTRLLSIPLAVPLPATAPFVIHFTKGPRAKAVTCKPLGSYALDGNRMNVGYRVAFAADETLQAGESVDIDLAFATLNFQTMTEPVSMLTWQALGTEKYVDLELFGLSAPDAISAFEHPLDPEMPSRELEIKPMDPDRAIPEAIGRSASTRPERFSTVSLKWTPRKPQSNGTVDK